MKRNADHFRGCLAGGAAGDALGWPVEFMSLEQLVNEYGPEGIQYLEPGPSGKAEITDDTQMTLFTAEGILRSQTRGKHKGISHAPAVVFYAYQRWLVTQGYPENPSFSRMYDGWLIKHSELHHQQAPGNTCLSALESGSMGDVNVHINNSKGCGGVMRAAPAGLFYGPGKAFEMGAEFAALTHGHPSGYLSAGALADIIAYILKGETLTDAVKKTMVTLGKWKNHEECTMLLEKALELVDQDLKDSEAVAQLGEGWTGEEALAISVYCALKYGNDFKSGVTAAVNHNGDSDSTGAITGNILGAFLGIDGIPADWLEILELKDVILELADDLLKGFEDTEEWWEKYPGY